MALDLLFVARHMIRNFVVLKKRTFNLKPRQAMKVEIMSFLEIWGECLFRFSFMDDDDTKKWPLSYRGFEQDKQITRIF